MIFRGIEARSDESLAKVPAPERGRKGTPYVEAGIQCQFKTKSFLVSTPDSGTIIDPENVIGKGSFIFNVRWPPESFSSKNIY